MPLSNEAALAPMQKSAFDEVLTAEATPSIQIQFPYNINTDLVEKRENNLGTVTQADGMAVMQSGAAANSAAHLLSKVLLKYRPGQGALVRFTALFTAGVADSVQLAGIGEVGDGLFFGFNGAVFSILRREQGKPEVQTVTITSGAVTATGNITINLDGVAKTVAVVSDDSAREVAVKIAAADFSDTGLGWSASVHNATVIFKAWSDGNKAGTFSLVDTDTTGVAGTFAETVAGVSTTNEWVAQTDWNEDKADGAGDLPILDPTKGNVFQIRYQWLGFGLLSFAIEDPADGEYHTVHTIRFANANVIPSLQNPTLPLHVMAKNMANTSNLTVKTGSMAAFVEGHIVEDSVLHGVSNAITGLGTTEKPILSIKNNLIHQSEINRVRVRPEFISLATDATKAIIFRIRIQSTLEGPVAFTDVDADVSVISTDVAATGVTSATGREALTVTLGKTDSLLINVDELDKKLNPGEHITITAEAVSGSSHEASASLTWAELF
jgi:hypothetical protein